MKPVTEKIEQYLNKELSSEDQQLFEAELKTNKQLAITFDIYKTIETLQHNTQKQTEEEASLKQTLQQLNTAYFKKNEAYIENFIASKEVLPAYETTVKNNSKKIINKSIKLIKVVPFISIAAAACVILLVGWFFLFKPITADKLADRYIQQHMQTMSILLSNDTDSLEIAKHEFNNKNYTAAENIFTALSHNKDVRPAAIEYLGILHLIRGNYNQAIIEFEALSAESSLQVNYGLFYQALGLIKRNKAGDIAKAKINLNNIINNNLSGRKEAEVLIKKI